MNMNVACREILGGPLRQRGLFWTWYTEVDGVRRIMAYTVDLNGPTIIADTPVNLVTSLAELIEAHWPVAVEDAQKRAVTAADGIPWEIHLIEDQTAYEHALTAYLENQT